MAAAHPPLLVIVGPTAAGKSAVAAAVCARVGGEVISADSGQIYRGLDIGTAKPSAEERARTPHHAIDLCEPTEQLDAAAWAAAADAAIEDVRSRGSVPVVCGGTGFYVRALLHGLSAIPPIDTGLREAVRAEVAERGPAAMHGELAEVDPEAAARIAPRDPQRIGRALEVYRQTGRTLTSWHDEHAFAPVRYDARVVGLWPSREQLRARVNSRVGAMLEAGWIDEVRCLLEAGLPPEAPGLRTLGYRDVVAHVIGAAGAAGAEALPGVIATAHWRYARRQLTWFRGVTTREDALVHIDPTATADRPSVVDPLCALAEGRGASL